MEERLVRLAQALACGTRSDLLRRLGPSGCTISEVSVETKLAPSTVHYHLARLMEAGLVVRTRRGRRTIYGWGPTRWSVVERPADTVPSGAPP
ncbi:MAG: winged helix-turn-helix transcriptional regulator [Labilithrix sp.]|nr:winged helix-turn-helix transcriptional regulator [Labilithrix sp.]